MRDYLRLAVLTIAVAGLALGCRSSSHRSVRTYEYDEEPAPEQREEPAGADSEYEMVSPGEMVGPGEMVDE